MPKTLLLADDSVTIQKVVGISFASEDVVITTVDNGDDALVKARELHPDVILADVVMPGKSGYEVCEAVQSDPELRHIPVLLLTGTFEAFDEERATRAGAAGHVAKPFEAQTLVDRVQELLAATPEPAAAAIPDPLAEVPAGAPAAPSAAADSSDQAFDFFDEQAQSAARPEEASAVPNAGDSLDLDEPDAAFAFGDDDLAPVAQEPVVAAPLSPSPDATIAILPDMPGPAEDAAGLASPAPASRDEAFDFEFESQDTGGAPVGSDDLAQATLLDPAVGAGFDVSSSDLSAAPAGATQILDPGRSDDSDPFGEPLAPEMPGEAIDGPLSMALEGPLSEDPTDSRETLLSEEAITEPDAGDQLGETDPLPRDPVMDLLTPEPISEAIVAEPLEADPAEDTFPSLSTPAAISTHEPVAVGEVESSAGNEAARPFGAEVPAGVPMTPEPIAEAPIWPEEPAREETWPAEPEPLAAVPIDLAPEPLDRDPLDRGIGMEAEPVAAPAERAAAPEDEPRTLDPALRDQFHETLEKIAWDAFGQATEKIVQQSLERMEQVIWEVVPKLAEALIQEEIRKLKADDPE